MTIGYDPLGWVTTVIGTGKFMSYNLSRRANICLISPAYVNRRQIISLESHGLLCEIKLHPEV